MSSSNKIGVVIVTYNSESDIDNCVKSINEQTFKTDATTLPIVVDNNSKDRSLIVASESGAITIGNDKNLGFSKAVNLGIKKAYTLGCSYILVLNPDAILLDGSLSNLMSEFMAEDGVGATGPLMVHSDGSDANEGYYLKAPSLLTVACFSTLLRPWALKRKWLKKRYEETLSNERQLVEQIPGACLFTSKEVLDKIGLLDEDFAIWFEDVEWSYRARKNNFKLVFCPDARVVHEGGVSFSKWQGLEKSVTFYVSMKTFFRKSKPLSLPFVVLTLALNAFISYLKGRDQNQLKFIKKLFLQKQGNLPN